MGWKPAGMRICITWIASNTADSRIGRVRLRDLALSCARRSLFNERHDGPHVHGHGCDAYRLFSRELARLPPVRFSAYPDRECDDKLLT